MSSNLNAEDARWLEIIENVKSGKLYASTIRANAARTTTGEVCTCMTHNKTWGKYSATYVQTNGVRELACREWDLKGVSLSPDLPDLDMRTVSTGMRVI